MEMCIVCQAQGVSIAQLFEDCSFQSVAIIGRKLVLSVHTSRKILLGRPLGLDYPAPLKGHLVIPLVSFKDWVLFISILLHLKEEREKFHPPVHASNACNNQD